MLVAVTTCHIWSTLTTVQMASPLDLAVCDVAAAIFATKQKWWECLCCCDTGNFDTLWCNKSFFSF